MKGLPSLLALVALAAAARATPSGLNNIPTADTAPQGTFVLQGLTNFGEERDADLILGGKTGLEFKPIRLELGLFARVAPGRGGPVLPHGKISLPFGDRRPTVAIGLFNGSFRDRDRRRAGDEFAYGVISQDLGWFRVHAGCGLQEGETLPFFGLDRTFKYTKKRVVISDGKAVVRSTPRLGGNAGPGSGDPDAALETRDLFTLRGDVIALRDQSWLYSVGVLVPISKYFVVEAWGNLPDNGSEPFVTLKGNIVITF